MTYLSVEVANETKYCGLGEDHEPHRWVDSLGGAYECVLPEGVEHSLGSLICRGETLASLAGKWQRRSWRRYEAVAWEDLDEHSGSGALDDLFEVRVRPTMEHVRLDQVAGRKLAGRTWTVKGFECFPSHGGAMDYHARSVEGPAPGADGGFFVSADGLVEVQPLEVGESGED